jgi:hypothetical protein
VSRHIVGPRVVCGTGAAPEGLAGGHRLRFRLRCPGLTQVRLFHGLAGIEGSADRHQLSLELHEKKNCEIVPEFRSTPEIGL